jgi:uncharacterized protein
VRPKAELLRLVAVEGRVRPDPAGKLPGRGAYVCDDVCAERAVKRRALSRALRHGIEIPPDFVESVRLHGQEAHP